MHAGPMLTISQVAAYAGVTVRAVRHYHRIGLLPEPERDASGYRAYDADAVVRLIRISTLAGAGVPLARVQELLDAGPDEFAAGIREVDAGVRAEIRRLQGIRARLGELEQGAHPALPPSVVGYLDRLRSLGVGERYVEMETEAWIMVASQVPHQIDEVIEQKHAELDDPEMVELYQLLGQAVDWSADDPRVVEVADRLERLMARALASGAPDDLELDNRFVDLLDAKTLGSSPVAERLLSILAERGWNGWTRIERAGGARPEDGPSR
jgi:DNA-binding transcriptional MerR regulator